MFDYKQLETLVDVEREGSFENTAQANRVSKSAVSQKIRLIDHRIGFATVGRNPSNPTRFGRSICRHVEMIRLLESRLALRYGHIFNADAFDRSMLRVAVDDDLPSRCLMEYLEPNIDRDSWFPVETVISQTLKAVDRLEMQEVSAAISSEKSTSKSCTTHILGEVSFVATASPEYARVAFLQGFCGHSVASSKSASYEPTNELNARFIKQSFGVDLGPPDFKIPSQYGILNLCLDGFAWSMLPRHLINDHLNEGRLVDVCPGHVLKVPLFWHVSSFLDDLIIDITNTVQQTAQSLVSNPS